MTSNVKETLLSLGKTKTKGTSLYHSKNIGVLRIYGLVFASLKGFKCLLVLKNKRLTAIINNRTLKKTSKKRFHTLKLTI